MKFLNLCSFIFVATEAFIVEPWAGVHQRCNDPAFWCKNKETAEECGVRILWPTQSCVHSFYACRNCFSFQTVHPPVYWPGQKDGTTFNEGCSILLARPVHSKIQHRLRNCLKTSCNEYLLCLYVLCVLKEHRFDEEEKTSKKENKKGERVPFPFFFVFPSLFVLSFKWTKNRNLCQVFIVAKSCVLKIVT